MASEYVHEIRLQNSLGHWCDVPVCMDIELPDILYVDSKLAPYPAFPGYFKLQARHCSPAPVTIRAAHQTTAMYHQYAIGIGEFATCLNYLMYPSTGMMWMSPQSVTYSPSSAGPLFPTLPSLNARLYPGTSSPSIVMIDPAAFENMQDTFRGATLSTEPDCYCDIRALMSADHPAHCAWMVWKQAQRKEKKA